MPRVAAILCLLPFAALAQSTIQGIVLDPAGAAVPDAAITATPTCVVVLYTSGAGMPLNVTFFTASMPVP